MVGKISPSEVSNFLKRQNFMAIIFALCRISYNKQFTFYSFKRNAIFILHREHKN